MRRKYRRALPVLAAALAAGVVAAPASANPHDAISKNLDKNGAFERPNPGNTFVTNGNVNFAASGAMRALNGQGNAHAADNSAVDAGNGDGTRVEPPGLF